jgi:2-keto-3-deoxy-L-fuconate dehydrogenase
VSGDFDGLVAAVTGGASGIGAAIAEQLRRGGASVAVLDLQADRVAEPLVGFRCDVSDDASVRSAVQSVVDRFGGLDIVVNNAGVGAQGTVADNSDQECSIAATAGLPQRALYSATKGAVLALTQAMAADHLREGIRVNCVNPGTADTPWVGRLLDSAPDPAAERAALEARQPHGRLVSAEEVAGAVAYLASPRSGSTTGIALAVDGGMQTLRLRPPGQ